jgi:hypothetical protein
LISSTQRSPQPDLNFPTFRLQGLIEAFNALNRVDGVTNDGVFGSGSILQSGAFIRRITSVANRVRCNSRFD